MHDICINNWGTTPFCYVLCLGMHSNVMHRFMVQAFQDPRLCSRTYFSSYFPKQRVGPGLVAQSVKWASHSPEQPEGCGFKPWLRIYYLLKSFMMLTLHSASALDTSLFFLELENFELFGSSFDFCQWGTYIREKGMKFKFITRLTPPTCIQW